MLCEAYVHEIAEHSLDFSHRCATLMELCVLPEGGSLNQSDNEVKNKSGLNKKSKSKSRKKKTIGQSNNKIQSNFKRLPRRILTQIHAMDVRALHFVERDTDRSICNNSTLGMNLSKYWNVMTKDCRILMLRIIEYIRPSRSFTLSKYDADVHVPLISIWGRNRHNAAVNGLFKIFTLSGCPFLLPQEEETLESVVIQYNKKNNNNNSINNNNKSRNRPTSISMSSTTSEESHAIHSTGHSTGAENEKYREQFHNNTLPKYSPTTKMKKKMTPSTEGIHEPEEDTINPIDFRRDILSTIVARAHLASCLAVSIKQAVRVAMKHKLVNFYKPTMNQREWPTYCEDFGIFDEQLLQNFLDQNKKATPSQCRERLTRLRMTMKKVELELKIELKDRKLGMYYDALSQSESMDKEHLLLSQRRDIKERIKRVEIDLKRACQIHRAGGTELTEPELDRSWQLTMFFESLYLSMIGSSTFSQEANWLLEEANVGYTLRWCIMNISVPLHSIGRKLKVYAVDQMLWKGRDDITQLMKSTEIGLNRTFDLYEPPSLSSLSSKGNPVINSWYVKSFNPKKNNKCYLEVREETAISNIYLLDKKDRLSNKIKNASNGFSSQSMKSYEPENKKGRKEIVHYKIRSWNELSTGPTTLPLAKMNTKEILNMKTGELKTKIYYEYADGIDSDGAFPAGAEFEDENGKFIKKRFYDILGRVTGETLSVPRKLNRRAPKITNEKYHLTGWLSKRKKKTFGWTSKNLRFFVSDPLQGKIKY